VNLYLRCFRLLLTCYLYQPATAAGFIYCSSLGGASPPPTSAGFIYLGFSWAPAPPLFSSVESCPSSTAAVLIYLEFAQGTSLPPLSGAARQPLSDTLPTPSSLAGVSKPTFSGKLVYLQFMWMPAPPFMELKVPCSLCHVSFPILCLLFSFLFCGVAEVSLSRGLCWFIPGVAVGISCATYLLTCWSASAKQVKSQLLAVWEPSWFVCIM
jgi:hypothetical protein